MISIIAPAYNNPGEVKKLLASISASANVEFPFEAIIADDGSKDFSIKEAVEPYHFARYIRLDKNSGAAAARNEAAKQSRYDALLFLDSDVVVFADTIARAGKYFSNPNVKAFVGRLDLLPENEGFHSRYKVLMFNSWLPKGEYSTAFSPAIGGVRKDIFFESRGFDETIKGASVEYMKFSYELRERCVIHFYSDLVVRVKIKSFAKALYTDFYSTMKWVTIFSRYKKFDNHCTTVSGGLGRLFGFITLISLPFCVAYGLYFPWLLIFVFYVYLNRHFFILVFSRESFLFLLRSLISHLIFSSVTVLGGISGLAIVIKKKISNIPRII